jgi:hypothetical protein
MKGTHLVKIYCVFLSIHLFGRVCGFNAFTGYGGEKFFNGIYGFIGYAESSD